MESKKPEIIVLDDEGIKGAILMMIEDINGLYPKQLAYGLKELFDYNITAEALFRSLDWLKKAGHISSTLRGYYTIRNLEYSSMESSKVRNIVTTNKLLLNKYNQWKKKVKDLDT